MKELSIKEKGQAYDKAIKEAYIAYKDEDRHLKSTLERIFPELKESENGNIGNQNSLKSTNIYKSKLQKGDWITIEKPCQIINVTDNKVHIVQYCDDENIHILSRNFCESHFHHWSIEEAKDGSDIYLTIDSNIQLIAENLVTNLTKDYEMEWLVFSVMDAKTGAILANSTYPNFNPNDLNTLTTPLNS